LIKRRGRFSVIQNHHVASPDEAASSDSMTLTCITDLCCPAPPCRDAAASASSCAATSDAATSPSANLVSRGMGDARSQQMQGTKGKSLPPWAAQRRLLCRLLEVPAQDLWPWLLSALREFKWLAKSPEGSAWLAAQQCLTVSAPSGDEACWLGFSMDGIDAHRVMSRPVRIALGGPGQQPGRPIPKAGRGSGPNGGNLLIGKK